MLHRIAVKLDNLSNSPFPYAMAVHQKPCMADPKSEAAWHFHIHFLPPIARNAVRRKFMTAYELAFMDKRDSTPEETARRLRASLEKHYSVVG
jgi:UDPglucose--hexose-1-phosphate uridylyltransferase